MEKMASDNPKYAFSDINLTPVPSHPGIKYLFPHPGWIAARAYTG